MKTILTFTICLFLSVLSVSAQERHGPSKEQIAQIETIKIAFITDRLDLTTNEAKGFWPIYNKYQAEVNSLWDQKRSNWNANNKTNPAVALTTDLALDRKLLDTKVKYLKQFQNVVPAQKVLALYRAEPEFREYLMKQLRNRSGGERKP